MASRAGTFCRIHKRAGAYGGAGVSRHFNESQRNVTLWASLGSGTWTGLLIVAGFFVTDVFPRNFDSFEVYKWLEDIYLDVSPRADTHVHRILRLPNDPRVNGLPEQYTWSTLGWMLRVDDAGQNYSAQGISQFQPGHYMVVLVPKNLHDRAMSYQTYVAHSGQLAPLIVHNRGRPKTSGTGSSSSSSSSSSSASSGSSGSSTSSSRSRDQTTVSDARLRDGGCVVTKQYARIRARGYAYEGLEVAHIYPLAFAQPDRFIESFPPGHPIYNELDIDINFMTDQSLRKALDCVKNCIVLRADLHALFDQYQFSFKKDGNRWYLVRFERGARPFHKDLDAQVWMEGRTPTTKAPYIRGGEPEQVSHEPIDGPCEALLESHYRTAVSWHVAGAGTNPRENAILVQTKINPGGPLLRWH